MKKSYNTDMSPNEWQVMQYLFPRAKKLGKRKVYSGWPIMNSILYVLLMALLVPLLNFCKRSLIGS